jgi:hypothetical protein
MSNESNQSEAILDPQTAAAIKSAFDKATKRYQGERYNDLRKIIARRIVAVARTGVQDPGRLCTAALDSIGLHD